MATAQEIAVAYVSIVPSLRGVQGNIAKEFAGIDAAASRAGGSSGSAFSRTFQAGIKAATQVATASVAAAGVGMGVALTKGLGRLNAIDSAKAKLRGLGNDGETTAVIMQNATAAVKGTAFGLDEAATTAAGAVAAGIKPGQQLESTLKTVANVAAATGRGMDEMGAVFNQVAAGGKAYTMQVKQIADAGLPIWQKLSEELGVTTDQVQKMVSAGEVDFATFERAASAAAGNVAQEMGTTLPGAIDNAWAAVSRFGANVWKGFDADDGTYTGIYSKLADLVQAFTNAMGPIEDLGSKIGDFLGDKLGPTLQSATDLLNRFGDAGDSAGAKFKPLLTALAPAGAMFAALGARGLAPLLAKLGPLSGLLGPLPGLLKVIGGPAGVAAAGLFALSKVDPTTMAQGFNDILQKLPSMLEGIIDTISHVATQVIPAFVEAITTNLPVLIDGVMSIIDQVVVALVEALPILLEGAITLFSGLLLALVEVVPPLVEGVIGLIPTVIEALVSMIPVLIEGALALFMGIVEAIPLVIPDLITSVIELIPVIIESLVSMIPALLDGAVQLFTALVQALPIILPVLIDSVIGLIPVIVDALISSIGALIEGAVTLFTGIIEALPIIIPELVNALIDLGPVLVDALIELVPQLIQAGKDLLAGLAQGLVDGVGQVLDSITDVGSQMLGGIKNFFGISSPSKVMAQIGEFLDQGLAGGVTDGAASVASVKQMSAQVMAPVNALQKSFTALAKVVAAQVASMMGSLKQLIGMMGGAFRSRVTGELNAVARAFQTILPRAVQAAVNAMRQGMSGFASWAGGAFRSLMVSVLNAVQAAFKNMQVQVTASMVLTRTGLNRFGVWTGGTFRSSLVSAVRAIQTAFTGVPPAVVSSWSRMRSGTAQPTNYVISTVYMNGIRAAVNAITSAAGVKMSMPSVRTIRYAAGGVLPGYTPGRDIYDFYNPQVGTLRLSGGEGILRPEVVRALGAGTIDAWNASRGRDVHAFAGGGILDFLTKGAGGWSVRSNKDTFLAALYGDIAGSVRGLVRDPAREYAGRTGGGQWGAGAGGSMANLAGVLTAALISRVKAAQPEEGSVAGSVTGGPVGAFRAIGWQAMSKIIRAQFPGARITSTYRPGRGPSMHNFGRAIDIASSNMMQIAEWLLRSFPNSYQVLYSPLGARNIWWAGQRGMPPGYLMRTHYDHVHWSMAQGGIVPQLFDSGGWLQPGLTLAENRTGKPEPVFTSEQWDRMGGNTYNVQAMLDPTKVRTLDDLARWADGLSLETQMRGV